jgi:hypothetical protein
MHRSVVTRPGLRFFDLIDFEPQQADTSANAAFVFSAPRGAAQNEVCLDDVSLVGGGPG